ncbi:MAG: 3-dehydroquinate synthase [Deltaproteobacteria bacterium]|nr:3-dehydroquinate synthase [Deltaproteobacteria bacterium]
MFRLRCPTANGTGHPLRLGPGALDVLPALWRPEWRAAALVADRTVLALHGPAVLRHLRRCAPAIRVYEVPPGDRHKSAATWLRLADRMLADRLGRDTCLVALGGGVALDLGGFLAATFLRGIPHLLLPTTLLATVDASLGGKTGINRPAGKNLLGAFRVPAAVLADTALLDTLPAREWRGGLAEVVKHAVVADAALFARLEHEGRALRRPGSLDVPTLARAIRVKLDVVARDPFERGRRRVLNFGHTLGHALEAATGHRVHHGAAVAVGMAVEAELAVRLARFPAADRDRLAGLLAVLGLPTRHACPFERLLPHLEVDKKRRDGKVHLALPARLGRMAGGRTGWTLPVAPSELRAAWETRAGRTGRPA